MPLLSRLLIAAIATIAWPLAGAASINWADFSPPGDADLSATVSPIALSERTGDAQLDSLTAANGLVQVTGRLSDAQGSQWRTLGMDVAANAAGRPMPIANATHLRIRLAANAPQVLRIRLKGPDRRIQSAGCYPVMMQKVSTEMTDYLIPLDAFAAESYCRELAASLSQTLAALTQVEVTVNAASPQPHVLRIGRIDFTDETSVSDGGWSLAWSDEFAGKPGTAVDTTHWSLARGAQAAFDGEGHLALRGGRLQARPARAELFGRFTARVRLPLGAKVSLVGLPLIKLPWPEQGEIVLLERGPEGLLVGLHGPAVGSDTSAVGKPKQVADDGFHTLDALWDPEGVQWSVDGQRVRTLRRADLPDGTWPAFVSWPYALSWENPGNEAMVLDQVKVFQRPTLTTDAARALAAWQSGQPATKEEGPKENARPARKPVQARAVVSAAVLPVRNVVCERNHLDLMMCH